MSRRARNRRDKRQPWPDFAAGAMAMSSVFVLGNALRLRRLQPPLSQQQAAI